MGRGQPGIVAEEAWTERSSSDTYLWTVVDVWVWAVIVVVRRFFRGLARAGGDEEDKIEASDRVGTRV